VRRSEVTNDRRTIDEIGSPTPPAGTPRADPKSTSRLAFGRFVLDAESGRLLEEGHAVPLAPKPFETLLYLASRSGRVVSKTELMDKLWPGVFVTDDVLVQCIVDIRRALGDHAKTPEYIETLPRRGYQFLVPVRPAVATAGALAAASDRPRLRLARLGGARAVWTAVGLAVLAGVWVLVSRPARVSPPPAAAPIEPGLLLILPFDVKAPVESAWLRQGLAEILRSELGPRPGVHLVARHRLADGLATIGLDEDRAPASGPATLKLARGLGAERMVTGSFVQIQDRFVLSAQLLHVATDRADEITVRGQYPGELLGGVEELALGIAERCRGDDATGADAVPGRPIRLATRSVEAYRHYVEALTWFARGGSRGAQEAESHLGQAVRFDPAFAYAHLKKAEIQQWRRRLGYGDADPLPAVRAAVRLAQQLPEREQLIVQALEAQLVRGDNAAALSRCESLLRRHPSFAEEVGIPRMMADIYYADGRWDDLITTGEAHVDSPSMSGPERALVAALLAKAFRQKGELDRALSYARRAVRLWPAEEGPSRLRQRTDLGRVCLDAGRKQEAVGEFRAVAAAADADVTNLTDAAWGLYMAGQRDEAETLAARAFALDVRYGNAHHLRGWLRLARGDNAEAAASFERAFTLTPSAFGAAHLGFVRGDLAALYYAGVAYQKLDRREPAASAFRRVIRLCREFQGSRAGSPPALADWEAASLLAIAAARLGEPAAEPPRLRGDDATFFLQSARLHAVQGKRDQALRELVHALALAAGDRQHVYDDPNFDSLRGDPEFRRLLEEIAGG